MKKILCLLLLAFTFVAGCTGNQHTLPIRIGLLACSQITSPNSTPDCLYRNKRLDKEFKHTIRPPALEHLAKEMLDIALDKLSVEDVNVILYLGDGANSGGTDEVNDLFTTLKNHREDDPNIPIFMVIGNHDYLGAGNTSDIVERLLLLNDLTPRENQPLPQPDNRPLSKYQVLRRIHNFNMGNDCNVFDYNDNFADINDPNLKHDTGLYLAGHLKYSVPGKDSVEIFLADTSDYNDTPAVSKPKIRMKIDKLRAFIPKWDFYGAQGSISSKHKSDEKRWSQIDYLKNKLASKPKDFRFVASHYHPDNLDRKFNEIPEKSPFEWQNFVHGIYEMFVSLLWKHHYPNQHLKEWLSGHGRDYWLSAHTHRKTMLRPHQSKVHVGGILELLTGDSFRSVNIGSTTDYRAHVAVVEAYVKGKNKKVDKYVGFREIPLFSWDEVYLKKIFEKIKDFGRENRNDPNFRDAGNLDEQSHTEFGLSILGLNKEYLEDYWEEKHTDASWSHLSKFIQKHSKKYGEKELKACLAFIAGAYEEEKITKDCDSNKDFLKKLCKKKK